jgi:hypothetical protein
MRQFGFIVRTFAMVSVALTSSFMVGQTTTGQITGTVEDSTGAAISDATIVATNVDTHFARSVQSGGHGEYLITLLPIGNYEVNISRTGFQAVVEQAIKLDVNQSITISPKLKVGGSQSVVTVQAQNEQLNASSSSLGTVIGEKEVNDLPLNGRNFTQLLTLVPGATPISTSQGANIGTDDGSTVALPGSAFSNPSINGQQNRETLYLLDGVVNTDFRTTTYTVLPIVDGISEFKLQSHNDDPAFGSVLGGVVNLLTKSGTNSFHGSGWEFLRNNIFDARNPFSDINSDGSPAPVGTFRQNEFGVSIGGPVWLPKIYNGRNKTFFFFAYEGWRYTTPVRNYYTVPTAAQLGGNFQQSIGNSNTLIYDPTTTALNAAGTGYTRQAFNDSIIPAGRIDTQIQSYLSYYLDAPNFTPTVTEPYNEFLSSSSENNSNNYQGRIDQQIGHKDTIFFRWSNMFDQIISPETHTASADTYFNGLNIGAGITHIFSPNLIGNINGGRASRGFSFAYPSTLGTSELSSLGFAGLDTYGPLGINFDQVYSGTDLQGPALRRNSSWSVGGQLTYQRGRHSMSFGSMVIDDYRSQSGSSQHFTFDNDVTSDPQNSSTTGNALASALLGYPNTGGFGLENLIKYSIPTYGIFGGDSWKVNPKLTVNLGIRYDHLNQPNITAGMNNGFDFDTGNWEIGGGKLPGACVTTGAAPCIPGTSTDAATDLAAITGNDGSVAGSHIIVAASPTRAPASVNTEFGPRVGFAYRVYPTTVVSGGFGISYDTLNGVNQTLSNSIGEWPAKGSVTHTYYTLGTPLIDVSTAETTIGNPLTTGGPFSDFDYYYSPKEKPLYSDQFNLKVEQTVAKNTLLSIGYVGSVSRRLDYGGTANSAVHPTTGSRAAILADTPYPYMTQFVYDSSIGNGDYHSLQVKLEKQMSHGLYFLISYTWSKSLDDTSGHFGAENGVGGPAIQDYYTPESNRGVSGYDVPHFLSIAGLYAFPAGKGKRFFNSGPLSYVLGGWQLNTIAQLQSGQAYTLGVNGDPANIGNSGYGRPNLVGNPFVAHISKEEAYNPAAFAVPVGTFGDVGRNTLRGGSYHSDDLSLFKSFQFTERRSVEFRAEAFNVFNIINYGTPDTTITDTSAGVIGGMVGSPRQLQFALKLNF